MNYYEGIKEFLHDGIENPEWKEKYLMFHEKEKDRLSTFPASVKNHHMWEGGYAQHVWEVMSNVVDIFTNLKLPKSQINFSADEILCAAYIHDLDKLWRYRRLEGEPPSEKQISYARSLGIALTKSDTKQSVIAKIDAAKRGVELDEKQIQRFERLPDMLEFDDGAIVSFYAGKNDLPMTEQMLHAVCLHHGGWSPIARVYPTIVPSPMAALLHSADYISSFVQKGK